MTRRNLRIPTLPTRTQIARLRQMENERDTALLSLDEDKLRSYLNRWDGQLPAPVSADPRLFWGSVHKARAALPTMPEAAREESRAWLRDNGFLPFEATITTMQEGRSGNTG